MRFKIMCLLLFLFIGLASCGNNTTLFAPGGSVKKFIVSTFNVYYASTAYSPMPSGTSTVMSIFQGDSLWHPSEITMVLKTSGLSEFEALLNYNLKRSYLNFFHSYLSQNNLNINSNEIYSKIHLFGINNFANLSGDVGGNTISYGYMPFGDSILYEYPAAVFVFAGRVDSKYPQVNVEIRRKLKEFIACHELSHARGLRSLYSYDYVHICHRSFANTFDGSCVMSSPAWLFIENPEFYYPPHFCDIHRRIFQDSLTNYIITGLYLHTSCP